MKKTTRPVVLPVSKDKLRRLIKTQGLQISLFGRSLSVADWDGLEYLFHVAHGQLLLHQILVRMDVSLGPVKKYEKELRGPGKITRESYEE